MQVRKWRLSGFPIRRYTVTGNLIGDMRSNVRIGGYPVIPRRNRRAKVLGRVPGRNATCQQHFGGFNLTFGHSGLAATFTAWSYLCAS